MAEDSQKQSFVFAPILIWLGIIIFGIVFLVPFLEDESSEGYFVIALVFSLFERFGTAIGTLSLVRKSRLNQNVWAILALIFGANQLVLLNIAIWIRSAQLSK